jgi:hypothetical protein
MARKGINGKGINGKGINGKGINGKALPAMRLLKLIRLASTLSRWQRTVQNLTASLST